MLGSSRIYSEPVRLLPSDVERLIRWLSPPERVELNRLSVRPYSFASQAYTCFANIIIYYIIALKNKKVKQNNKNLARAIFFINL